MKLQPVRQYHGASFPTRAEVDASPETLRAVPRRWQRNVAVCTLLVGLGILAIPKPATAAEPAEVAPVVARIAPLFPYPGILDRMGIMGKIAIPKFLAEEDARQIIFEEAAKAGINFAPDVQVIEKVPMPVSPQAENELLLGKTINIPVTLDGTDTTRKISFEFVSNADVEEWGKQGINNYLMSPPAALLRDGMTQGVPAGTYAVFYDPASLPFQGIELRQQVKEFLAWLKAEGVI